MTTRTVGAGHGWKWLVQGVNVGRGNPRAVYGAIAILSALALLPSVLQLVLQQVLGLDAQAQLMVIGAVSLLSMVLYPLLIGGVLRVIDGVERGRPAKATDIFATFSAGAGAGRLMGFGVLMGVLYIATFYALISAFGEGVIEWYMEILAISQEMNAQGAPATPPELPLPPAGIGPLMALGLLFGLYFATVYAIGLGQVALGDRPVGGAFVDGLGGALKNVLPVIVVGVLAMAGGFVLMIVFAMVATMITVVAGLLHPALAALLVLPLYLLLLLALYIVMFGVMYAMWRDICGDPLAPDAQAPGGNGGGSIEL
ncbi:hypothetical protein LDO26_12985 [Luteimonas sp. BDR2-5]|uniref:hypothetical protein n=1 Tax=Proluteimonas luteida TaxID=2878685 RepID=UPI001E570931|nr:hypothetical protein [Luteimonas sp. BDR2-5]MCD9029115.1 hypothetical protein [Luteimonas sp. BDR2-5]